MSLRRPLKQTEMKGIIGKKVGMTSIFDNGKHTAVTVIEAGPCVVTQIKTTDKDGYAAFQLAFGDKKEKNTPNAMKGHFKQANTTPKRKVVEFRGFDYGKQLGESIDCTIFNEGENVNVSGTSKGKGFQGVVKRHHFSGVGMGSHGQHDRMRAPGSVGASSFPSKVLKGMRMAGRMGGKQVMQQNQTIVKIIADKNLILVKGAVPGHNGQFVIIES